MEILITVIWVVNTILMVAILIFFLPFIAARVAKKAVKKPAWAAAEKAGTLGETTCEREKAWKIAIAAFEVADIFWAKAAKAKKALAAAKKQKVKYDDKI